MNKLIGIFAGYEYEEDTEVICYKKGDEIIRNGSFDNSSYWNLTAGWSIAAGVAHFDDVTSNARLGQSDASNYWSILPNKNYSLNFVVTSVGNLNMFIGNSDGSQQYRPTANYVNGPHNVLFTTPVSIFPGGILFMAFTAGSAADIDNISLKEV